MKNGKFTARRTSGTKALTMLLALTLAVACAVGGTLAWLTAETGTVTNIFTVGDIYIELKEHTIDANGALTNTTTTTGIDSYKMVPGWTLNKDPFVTVKANSEKCYLFVKVEKSANFDTFMTYEMDTDWTQLVDDKGNVISGVFYRVVDAATADQDFNILKDKQVKVKGEVTKQQLNAVGNKPTLKFTAYAIQYNNSNTSNFGVYEAWNLVNPTT